MLETDKNRKELIIKMRENRRTFREIGETLGISRQRVQQIYSGGAGSRNGTFYKIREENKECVACGSSENIEIHHINRNRHHNNINNLMPLCRLCHRLLHSSIPHKDDLVVVLKKHNYNNRIVAEYYGVEIKEIRRWRYYLKIKDPVDKYRKQAQKLVKKVFDSHTS